MSRKHHKQSPKYRYTRAKKRAEYDEREWSISFETYCTLIANPCNYCCLPVPPTCGVGLDRLDNSRGYSVDNVVSCCHICNTARNVFWTPEEMKCLGITIRQLQLAKLRNNCELAIDTRNS